MAVIHDRIGTVFQGLLFFYLLGAIAPTYAQTNDDVEGEPDIESITPSEGKLPEGPLRFGDADSQLLKEPSEDEDEEENEPPQEANPPTRHPKPLSTISSDSADQSDFEPNQVPPTEEEPSLERSVSDIVLSVPAGADYRRELRELALKGDSALPELKSIFQDSAKGWEHRWIAASALGQIGGDEALEALLLGLSDPLFLIRMASLEALAAAQATASAPLIRKRLADPSMVVRSKAAESLGRLRDQGAVDLLIEELEKMHNFRRGKSLWVRKHILWALAMIGGERAENAMLSVLKEEDEDMKAMACKTLDHLNPGANLKMVPERPMDCAGPWLKYYQAEKKSSTSDSKDDQQKPINEISQDG